MHTLFGQAFNDAAVQQQARNVTFLQGNQNGRHIRLSPILGIAQSMIHRGDAFDDSQRSRREPGVPFLLVLNRIVMAEACAKIAHDMLIKPSELQ